MNAGRRAECPFPLRPWGRRGQGEVGDTRALADAHLTRLPRIKSGVGTLSPLKGGERFDGGD